jgi:hypothetical protein
VLGRQYSHSVAFIGPVQSSTPSRPHASLSVSRIKPATHSHTPETKSKTVLPEISHASHLLKSLGHEPHSGSKHRFEQSPGRIHAIPAPQPQSLHASLNKVYNGPQILVGPPRLKLNSISI